MNLKEVREKFIDISGRIDLVVDTEDYADAGADYFLLAGLRELDQDRLSHYHATARKYVVLESGNWIAQFQKARALKQVFCGDGSSLTQLKYKYYDELRDSYASSFPATSSGSPRYWTPINLRHSPDWDRISADALDAISAYIDTASAGYGEFNGVLITPPPAVDVTLEIHGLFYSDSLENDTDENYWTMSYPDILIMAGMRELERSYRNMTGANEWTAHIQQKLTGLDMDIVETQTSSTDRKRG